MTLKTLIKTNRTIFILALSCAVSVVFLTFRIVYSGSLMYAFLVWNLFLAIIPFALSLHIYKKYKDKEKKKMFWLWLIIWLLFFPNAFYIITDFIHLRPRDVTPLWYDVILLLSFSWNGIMLGFFSLQHIQRLFKKKTGWIFIFTIIFLSSFGIYLGRFLRWNSWDAITHPWPVIVDIFDRIANPFLHPRTYGMTVMLTMFFLVAYALFVERDDPIHEKNK